MKPYQRILVINPNRANAKLLRTGFEEQGSKVKLIYAGMDSVFAFEQFQPDAVVVDEALQDLPAEAVIEAFRQMRPDIFVFLCGPAETDELRTASQQLAVTGCITPPFGKVDWSKAMASVVTFQSEEESLQEEMTRRFYPDDPSWNEFPLLASHETRKSSSFNDGKSQIIRGNLKIMGDLEGLSRLDVTGSLIVEGNVVASKVRCGRSLKIRGSILNCKNGIFARGDVEAHSIESSLVVSGSNLIFGNTCKHANLVALLRVIGRSQKSKMVGGRIRAGEHVSAGCIGDDMHTYTQIQVAQPWMFEAWRNHKARLWDIFMRRRPRLNDVQKALFAKQVNNPKFFQLLGEILADRIYPGVDVLIGEKEDMIFEAITKPSRLSLGRKSKRSFGVCIRKRQRAAKSQGVQINTANLD